MTATGVNEIDPRHTARVIALQQLFAFYSPVPDNTTEDDIEEFPTEDLVELYDHQKYNEELLSKIIAGVKEYQERIDEVVKVLAPLWPIDQISLIDLTILRIGIWESFISKHVPEKVGVDEAIELAKEFSGEVSAKFVNGVLGNLLKNEDLKKSLQS